MFSGKQNGPCSKLGRRVASSGCGREKEGRCRSPPLPAPFPHSPFSCRRSRTLNFRSRWVSQYNLCGPDMRLLLKFVAVASVRCGYQRCCGGRTWLTACSAWGKYKWTRLFVLAPGMLPKAKNNSTSSWIHVFCTLNSPFCCVGKGEVSTLKSFLARLSYAE